MTPPPGRSSLGWPRILPISILAVAAAAAALVSLSRPAAPPGMVDDLPASIYDVAVKDIKGNDIKLEEYSRKVLLIVNVASKWSSISCMTSTKNKDLRYLHFLATNLLVKNQAAVKRLKKQFVQDSKQNFLFLIRSM